MSQPTWKSLIEQLREPEPTDPYLKRLRSRLDPAIGQASIEEEIISEMAAALGRAEAKLLKALAALTEAEAQWQAAPTFAERRLRTQVFNQHRAAAATARWELRVHRESLGLVRHQILDELYPIPPIKPLP